MLGPASGTDLANALLRQRFAAQHGLTPVDLSTYGGTVQFGYSLLSQYVCALVGARVAGAAGTVVAAYALARLLEGSRRPLVGSLAGAVCLAGDLVSGRTAFALGLAAGLVALLAVRAGRAPGAGLLAGLAAALSPVAGLFVLLPAVALVLTGRRRVGLALGAGAVVPLLVTGVVFGQGGDALVRWHDVWTGSLLALAVLAATRAPVVRLAAALQVLGLLAALVVLPSIGHNADRLVVLLAAPLVLALAPWRLVVVLPVVTVMVLLRPPLSPADLRRAGDPALAADFSAPVVAELVRLAPTGRVEAVPLVDHGEALHLSTVTPLARGWLRQLDTARAGLFYDGTLSAATYRSWLDDHAVQYVALADAPLDGAGRAEAALVRGGLPYLRQVFRGGAWRLYAVDDPAPLAAGATVVRSTPAELVLRVDAPGEVLLRLPPTRWTTLRGPGCLAADGDRLRLRAAAPGTYVVGSALGLRPADRC